MQIIVMMNHFDMEEKSDKLRLPSFGETPWLLCTHGNSKHKQIETFCSMSSSPSNNTKSYINSTPQLRNKHILGSSLGWLILCDRDRNIFSLFYPMTSQMINLPPLLYIPEDGGISHCALTTPPDCDDSVLLLCYNDAGFMFIYRRNCNSWATQRLEFEDGRNITVSLCGLLTVKGVIYGLANMEDAESELFYMKVDINSLTLQSLHISEPEFEFLCFGHMTCLVESCGHIYYVNLGIRFNVDPYYIAGKVWELDLQEKIWEEVKSLDGRAFFLSNVGYCTWCWGTSPEEVESSGGIQGDCLYFVDTYGPFSETILHSFNLVDQTWTMLASFPYLVSPYDLTVWVMPQLQRQRLLARDESKESIEAKDFNNVTRLSECQKLPQHNETQDGLFNKLPFHIVEMLPKYMHLFEYWNFRASSKILHSALPLHQCKTTKELPLFMMLKNQGKSCVLMDPGRLDSRSSSILPLYVDCSTLEFAKNGWLLTLVEVSSLWFFNLFTTVTIEEFPRLIAIQADKESYRGIAFSTYPTCPECLIVSVHYYFDCLAFYYLQPGDKKWHLNIIKHGDNPFDPIGSPPVFFQGGFHYLDTRGRLGVLRLMDELPSWHVYDPPNIEFNNPSDLISYLVECAGELYSVFMDCMGNRPIQVFSFEDDSKNWVEIEYLGDRILFISRTSCFSIVSKDPRMRNRIYLPRLKGKGIVFYSQATKKYHTLGSDDSLENLYGTTVPALPCSWIQLVVEELSR